MFFAGQPGNRRLGTSEKQKKNKGNLANCLKVPTLLGVENLEVRNDYVVRFFLTLWRCKKMGAVKNRCVCVEFKNPL